MPKPSIIISLDVEATGVSPATASCVMIGAVAMLANVDPDNSNYIVDKKQWCLEEQSGKVIEQRCWDEFWSNNMNVWTYIKAHEQPVEIVMKEFADWYADLSTKYDGLKFVMKPASYDWQWVNALYDEYGPENKPTLPFSNICLSTLISFVIKTLKINQEVLYEKIKCPTVTHTHFAGDDAHEQGYAYLKLLWFVENK